MRHHNGTIPVDGNKSPCQGARDNSLVDSSSVGRVAEIQRCQIGKVENENKLSPAKVAPHEQHDEGKVEQVVENEVTANSGGSVQRIGVTRPEMDNVDSLENE